MKPTPLKPRFKLCQGFTLIELLVVISIIGMLSSVILGSLSASREKGRIAALIQFDSSIFQAQGAELLAYLPFNGSSSDQLGNISGIVTGNSPTFVNDSPYGKMSAKFNGGYYAYDLDISETSFLLSFWFKSSSGGRIFSARKMPGGVDRTISLTPTGGSFLIYNPDETVTFTGSYMDNKWHHAVYTYKFQTTGQELRIDGKRVAQGNSTYSGFITQNQIFIGDTFVGQISDVRIYNASLND